MQTDNQIPCAAPSIIDGPFLEVAYCYDGTLEGLLSAVFAAYARHEDPTDVMRSEMVQARLGQQIIDIETDAEHAKRVQRGVCRVGSQAAFEAVRTASLSDDPCAGTAIYHFIQYVMTQNKPHDCGSCPRRGSCGGICSRAKQSALSDISHPSVEPLVRIGRAVANERHRMMQFLRFEHLDGGIWFARCSPKASVIPLLMDWFCARFNTQPFIIYDETHHLAGVYEGHRWHLVRTDRLNLPDSAADEQLMQQAWKRFYRTIAVESRYNPELRRQLMPKRFWKHITEMQDDLPENEPGYSLPNSPQARLTR